MTEFRGLLSRAARLAPLVLCAALISCSAPPKPILETAAPTPAAKQPEVFSTIAGEILNALEPDKRIAIQPFPAADLPIAPAQAQAFNDALAHAIEIAPEGRAAVVAREELPRLFAEAEEFGEATDTAKLLEAARADVLVVGALTPVRGGVNISYKAFDAKSGRQLASATPRFQAVDTAAPRGLPLDQAIATAADALARQLPEMKSVETLGIRYQQSGAQTALGGYIGRAVAGRLAERINGLQSSPAALLRPESADRTTAGADEMMVRAKPGVFMLSGSLWDLGQDVDVRLTLQGAGDRGASTGVRIRRDAIPAGFLPLTPPGTPPVRHDEVFDLRLSSDRGPRPVYGAGDQAHLVVEAARDGYLYCFHQASAAAGGGITKIFPNPFHASARIAGRSSLRIPDDTMGFALKVYGPAGVEQVRCFAVDRDVEAALPPVLLGRGLEPLAMPSLDAIGQAFRAAPGGLAEASLTMTVETRRAANLLK